MTVTAASFRATLPEFANTSVYSDAQVGFWLVEAGMMLPAARWGDVLDMGITYRTAHNLALARRDAIATQAGGVPGNVLGIETSKAVDKVSKSSDANSVAVTGAGLWNSTSYGIRFVQLARMVGAGGMQL